MHWKNLMDKKKAYYLILSVTTFLSSIVLAQPVDSTNSKTISSPTTPNLVKSPSVGGSTQVNTSVNSVNAESGNNPNTHIFPITPPPIPVNPVSTLGGQYVFSQDSNGNIIATEAPPVPAKPVVNWQDEFTVDLFRLAKKQKKLFILNLEPVWSHDSHRMEQDTYSNLDIIKFINQKYIPVKVNPEVNLELLNRYKDYAWPITIIFNSDGEQLVKKTGYIEPDKMLAFLQKMVDEPIPFSDSEEKILNNSKTLDTIFDQQPANGSLSFNQRKDLNMQILDAYDFNNGGWSKSLKYIDPLAITWSLENSASPNTNSNNIASKMTEQTLDENLSLSDPVWGGFFRFSYDGKWNNPHDDYEKTITVQTTNLKAYSLAYAKWGKADYKKAADKTISYLNIFLTSPDSLFYSSQDSDVSQKISGTDYYSLATEDERLKTTPPKTDRSIYTQSNALAISALCNYSNATGDTKSLNRAISVANWLISARFIKGGGFRHVATAIRQQEVFLLDNVYMGWSFLNLYRSTGDIKWLNKAMDLSDYIENNFYDEQGGYHSVKIDPAHVSGIGDLEQSVRTYEENVYMVRFNNLLFHYTGKNNFKQRALYAMRYLSSKEFLQTHMILPGVLIANYEVNNSPVHLAIIGDKKDPLSIQLHQIALTYPSEYVRLVWLNDVSESINTDIHYPKSSTPVAYICSLSRCSAPIISPEKFKEELKSLYN